MKQPPFIKKLVHLLSKYEKCIDCADDGTHFTIKNPAEFARNVLGKYFKSNQLQSFVHQLNKYGFKRLSSVRITDSMSFYHPYYNRDDYQHIKRRKAGNLQDNRPTINTQAQIHARHILSTQMSQSGVPHATSNQKILQMSSSQVYPGQLQATNCTPQGIQIQGLPDRQPSVRLQYKQQYNINSVSPKQTENTVIVPRKNSKFLL